MKRMLSIAFLFVLTLCATQAETQEPKKKPAVTLTLLRVRGVEFFSTPLEGPMKGQKVRNVILACDVVINNQTGDDLTVLSNFFSGFDGLSIVVLKESKELRSQSYLFHQSPMAEKRPYVLKKGRNETDMRFPISELPGDWEGLEVKITGYLPGSKFEEKLVSNTTKIQRVKDLSKYADKKEGPTPLPPEIVKAWRDAGFEVGWMKDVPPQSPAWGFWQPWREKGEAAAIPAFVGRTDDVLEKLPEPATAFGLDFHCGACKGDVTVERFARFKNLQSLNLGAVRNPERKTQIDLKDLAGMTNLRALYLFYLPVKDVDLKHVAELKNLQVLDLSSTRVTDAGIKELTRLKDLRWLNLQTAGLTAKGIAALQKDLPKCKIITHEREDDDESAYAAIRKLGAFADRDDKHPGRPIIAVDFNGFSTGVDFGDKYLREMALPLLVKLKHLEQLDLGGTGLADAGMKEVAKLKQLRLLWLAGTTVTDDGLKELAALEQLNSLFLANDKITGVGFRHLAGLKNLKTLTLRGLELTDAGVKELAALKQLQRLDLYESSFNDTGVKELARLEQLAWLNLSRTKVTDAGLKELEALKKLRTLRLYNTQVTVAAINELQKVLPHCRIEITAESIVEPELTAEVAKQALLEMMRSKPGKALGFFNKELVDEMAKMDVEKKKDQYHWTGAYRFDLNPGKRTTYALFVSLDDGRPPLRPHPKGYLIHVRFFQGSFAINDGRWIATVPTYKYALLD